MGDGEGVDIRVRTTGAKRAAKDVHQVDRALGGLDGRARRATGGLRVFSRVTTSATGGLRLMGGAALYGGAAIGGILLIGIKKSTDAWTESRKVTAQSRAVIKSTGGAAHITASGVDALSGALSRKTATDDEAIQQGANLLLTFKKVRNETGAGNAVFNRATAAAVDLSAAGFGSITGASKQLGKALNDPVKGMTALGRSGVTFTQGQKDQIEALVKTGDVLGAQKIILREVESQVGGSAKAQATSIDRMKVSWENVEESIGKGLSPVVDSLADKVDGFLVSAQPKIDAFSNRLGKIFKRKDLDLSEKFSLAGKDISRTTRPLRRQLERELGEMKLGKRLGAAVQTAGPEIMEALGRIAGKGAGAFLRAWWDTGVTGKLFTLALIGGKLGAFSALGSLAWRRFRGAYGRSARRNPLPPGSSPAIPGAGRAAAARAGASIVPAVVVGAGLKAATDKAGVTGGRSEQARRDWIDRNIPGMSSLRGLGQSLGLDPKRKTSRVTGIDIPNVFGRKAAVAPRRTDARPRVKAGPGRPQTIVIHTTATMPLTASGAKLVARGVNRVNADTKARK